MENQKELKAGKITEQGISTINIKGKDYATVNERVKYFRNNFKDYRLVTNIISLNENYCVLEAQIFDPNGNMVANGLAREEKESTFVNKTSYVENCETSAWGRALGNLGIGITDSIASAEELVNAINNQPSKTFETKDKDLELQMKALEIYPKKVAIYLKKEESELTDEEMWKAVNTKKQLIDKQKEKK